MPLAVESVEIMLAGHTLHLLADRAVYWPARQRLLIADLHLGKSDTFRLAGISVPTGGTRHDLERLGRLLEATAARECWILGDLVHGQVEHGEWIAQTNAFIAAHSTVVFGVIAGNHDRALHRAGLTICCLDDAVEDAGLTLLHEPPRDDTPGMSGHLHPVLRLPGEPRRLPVFWQRGEHLVLPAFSAFTGGWRVQPVAGESVHACNGEGIVTIRC